MRCLSRLTVLVSGFALAVWAQPGHTQL